MVIIILLGWLHERIQALLPNRFYDIRDAVFNTLAAVMAILASEVLMRVRQRFGRE